MYVEMLFSTLLILRTLLVKQITILDYIKGWLNIYTTFKSNYL
ncbi:hypothetical protein CMALT430_420001 [Carnobacterium maltaromaticum]|nr:hypothetical protein CMALT430_420001 [Carnobacterium maltaromaticum]